MIFCKPCGMETDRSDKGRCKACSRRYASQYRDRNPEKVKAGITKWRAINRDTEKERSAAWRRANPERARANNASWNAANPGAGAAASKAWKVANREKVRVYEHNRRAAVTSSGNLSPTLVATLIVKQRGKCACCRSLLARLGYHMDHIDPLSRGGANEDWNIQLLCPACNVQKRAKLPHIFMQERGYLL